MKEICIVVLVSIGITATCAKGESSKTCRNYVTNYKYTSGGSTSSKVSSWDRGTLIYTLESDSEKYYYSSLKDFVDAGRSIGRALHTKVVAPTYTGTITYNAQQQMTASAYTGSITVNVTCSAWDSNNRPTSCLQTSATCANLVISHSYDDAARKINRTFTGGTGGGCAASTNTDTFDANLNIVSSVTGVTALIYENTATKEECY